MNRSFQVKRWEFLARYLEQYYGLNKKDRILDVGGGRCPFLLVKEYNKRNNVCVDPYTLPGSLYRFGFVANKIESFYDKQQFDKIFSLSSLDQVDNLIVAMDSIRKNCKKGGLFILALNTYSNERQKEFIQKNWKVLDKPHPQHFTRNDIINLMRFYGFKPSGSFKMDDIFPGGYKDGDNDSLITKLKDLINHPSLILRILTVNYFNFRLGGNFRPYILYIFQKVK